MTQHNLKTKQTKLTKLTQHPQNPRNGDVDLIAESLSVNGQYKPIVTTTDGTILAGNHTYQAALSLGWETLTTVTLDLDPNGVEAKRVMLADNRTSDVSTHMYDDALLTSLLEEMESGIGLAGSGYQTVSEEWIEPPKPDTAPPPRVCDKCGNPI